MISIVYDQYEALADPLSIFDLAAAFLTNKKNNGLITVCVILVHRYWSRETQFNISVCRPSHLRLNEPVLSYAE